MSFVPLNNTIFSGDARAVTPTAGDSDTSIATTEFVQGELGNFLPLDGGTMLGNITLDPDVDLVLDATSEILFGGVTLSQYDANTFKADQDFAAGGNLIAMQGLDEEVVIGNSGPGGMSAGITLGTDTNLYRFDSNMLKTDGDLITAGLLTAELGADIQSDLNCDGKASFNAGLKMSVGTGSGSVTVNPDVQYIYLVDTSVDPASVALPADHNLGDMVVVKDHSGNAELNNITVTSDDGDLIDGGAEFIIGVDYQAVTLVSDGTNWAII